MTVTLSAQRNIPNQISEASAYSPSMEDVFIRISQIKIDFERRAFELRLIRSNFSDFSDETMLEFQRLIQDVSSFVNNVRMGCAQSFFSPDLMALENAVSSLTRCFKFIVGVKEDQYPTTQAICNIAQGFFEGGTIETQELLDRNDRGTQIHIVVTPNREICVLKHVEKDEDLSDEQYDAQCDLLEREIRNLSQLQHPYIIKAIPCEQGILLPYMNGGDLVTWLQQGGSVDCVSKIMLQVGLAINYLHQRGLVYRDLKPDNILLSINECGEIEARLSDFELLTDEFDMLDSGSPEYAAPEIFDLQKAKTTKVDIWSFGASLFGIYGRGFPFSDDYTKADSRSFEDILWSEEIIAKFETSTEQEEVGQVIEACLQNDPQKRPSMEELLSNFTYFSKYYPRG